MSSEARFPSIRNLFPRSISSSASFSKKKSNSDLRKSKSNAENTPPIDPNIVAETPAFAPKQAPPSHVLNSQPEIEAPENGQTRASPEITASDGQTRASLASESPVKVFESCNFYRFCDFFFLIFGLIF